MIGYFKLTSKQYNINLELNNKVTILTGFSAIGKTKMIKIYNYFISKTPGVYIESSDPVVVLNESTLRIIPQNERYIYLIDEDVSVNTKYFADIVSRTNSLFIIINKENLEMLNYGIEDIYTLVKLNNKNVSQHKYSKSYNIFNKNAENIIEDSKSGFIFYNNILNNCKTSKGNSNIIKFIDKNKKQNIILDSLSIGPYINDIMYYVNRYKAGLVLQESFEGLINRSIFNNKADIPNNLSSIDTIEGLETKKCIENFNKIFKNYSKAIENTWLLEEAQVTKVVRYIKEHYNSIFNIEEDDINTLSWN